LNSWHRKKPFRDNNLGRLVGVDMGFSVEEFGELAVWSWGTAAPSVAVLGELPV
jgi:hypothetical protein